MTDAPSHLPGVSTNGSLDDARASNRMVIGVVKERTAGERRGALVPEPVGVLQKTGLDVVVECGAGADAWFSDDAYADAGAALTRFSEVLARDLTADRSGQISYGYLYSSSSAQYFSQLASGNTSSRLPLLAH
jgi:NAD/NADP transhydrogenase alpha subunit